MLSERPFDAIKTWADANIVPLVQEATGVELNRHGRMPCPLHGGESLNFAVSADGFCCHSECGERGDAVRFLVLHRGLPDTRASRVEVMRSLAERAGVTLSSTPERMSHVTDASNVALARTPSTDPFKPTSPTPDTSRLAGGDNPAEHTCRVRDAVCVYPWRDQDGSLVALQARVRKPNGGKGMVWFHPDGQTGMPVELRHLVYRLPELRQAIATGAELACVAEGEKDTDMLRSIGYVATCNPNGAKKWTDAHAEHLRGICRVAIFADNDLPGREHAEQVKFSLQRVLTDVEVRIITLDPGYRGYGIKDVTDLVAACRAEGISDGRVRRALDKRIADSFASEQIEIASSECTDDDHDHNGTDTSARPQRHANSFPASALYGPIGEWVTTWAPFTEAAPVALYATALAALGAMIGRGAYLRVNADQHAPRLFVLLVGPSGRGRKGVTVNIMRSLIRAVDEEFAREREATGLSTTEGFVNRLRDETPARMGPTGKELPSIPGVSDKRLLVIEEEAGGLLKVMRREGNDLSATLRTAWDGRTVQRITKGDPMTATDPHLVFVGAITPTELREQLRSGDVFNGFANRLLPIYADSGTLLPFGGMPDPSTLAKVTDRIRDAVRWARAQRGELYLDPNAKQWFASVYPRLVRPNARSEGLRVLQERGAPYVLRIALLLAMLDRTRVIRVEHLEAAFALWQYAASTWGRVFPDDVRGGLAGRLEQALRDAGALGLTRTQLRKVAGSNNIENEKITAALHELAEDGLVERLPDEPTRGRPAERWRHLWCAVPASDHADNGSTGAMGGMGEKVEDQPTLFECEDILPIDPLDPMFPSTDATAADIGAAATSHTSHSSYAYASLEAIDGVTDGWAAAT